MTEVFSGGVYLSGVESWHKKKDDDAKILAAILWKTLAGAGVSLTITVCCRSL